MRLRRRHGRGRTEIDRNAEQPPLTVYWRVGQLEIDLRRHRGKETCHPHHAVSFDLRQQTELRIDHGHSGQVDIVAPLSRENLGKACCGVDLKSRCAQIPKHGVIAGLVGLVERKQRRADQDDDAVAVDLRLFGCSRRRLCIGERTHGRPRDCDNKT